MTATIINRRKSEDTELGRSQVGSGLLHRLEMLVMNKARDRDVLYDTPYYSTWKIAENNVLSVEIDFGRDDLLLHASFEVNMIDCGTIAVETKREMKSFDELGGKDEPNDSLSDLLGSLVTDLGKE